MIELFWELSDAEELELPLNWDLYNEDQKKSILFEIIVRHVSQEYLEEYIEEQAKERVIRRQDGKTKGYMGGI